MNSAVSFPYHPANSAETEGVLPYLPVALSLEKRIIQVEALLDSGASVNVLPYTIGLQLGAIWDAQTTPLQLAGNLARAEARGLLVMAQIASFEPIRLVFAWTRSDNIPVIMGQMNFFQTFNVCFFRSQFTFEIQLNT